MFRPSLYHWTKRQYEEDGPFDKWLKTVRTCRTRASCCGPSGFSNIIIRDFPDKGYTSNVIAKNYRETSTAGGAEGTCEKFKQKVDAAAKAAAALAAAAKAAAAKALAEKKAKEEADAKAAATIKANAAAAAAAKAAAEKKAKEEAAKRAAEALAYSRTTSQVNLLMENTIKNTCSKNNYG